MKAMARRYRIVVSLVVPLLAACRGDKPEAPVALQPIARVEIDSGRTLEVIGLRQWTVDMLRDSLRKYAPDDSIQSDATAANLRNLLGFADAAVTTHSVVFDDDDKSVITLAVREPRDSARVHYTPQELDSLPRPDEWKALTLPFAADTDAHLVSAVASAHLEGMARVVIDSTVRGRSITHTEGYEFESPADSLAARPFLDALRGRTTAHDLSTAIETIERSTAEPDRLVAVLILANFPTRDEAWRALLTAAVGREQGRDAAAAQQALTALSARATRPVDWAPMTATIHAVLDGTALAALAPLASALAATGARPANAVPWLGAGGEMLVASLESDNPLVRDPAHRLLVALRGEDLGPEPDPWREWIATLAKPPAD